MIVPAWLWIGTPLKLSLWLFNRFLTWTGLRYLWRRLGAHPWFWVWLVVIHVASFGGLCAVFLWLHLRASH